MNKEEIKIGKKVWYHPILNFPEKEEAIITTEPFDMYGTTCCFINIRTSVVNIENLEERI